MMKIRGLLLLRLAALAVLLGGAAALSFGYLGWAHPAFDSFSHFRVHLGVLMALFALPLLLLRFWGEAVFALAVGAAAVVGTVGPGFGPALTTMSAEASNESPANGAVYRLLHLNLRYNNAQPELALSQIGRIKPDVITLNEVSEHWVPRLEVLKSAYPYGIYCPLDAVIGGVAILSRRPLAPGTEPSCGDRGSFATAMIDFSGRPVEIATVHLGWPWPFDQQWQVPIVAPLAAKLSDTAILAGDFNAAPWSNTVRSIADAGQLRVVRGIGPTYLDGAFPDGLRRSIGLPIDNVLVKGGVLTGNIATMEDAGSDHLPVLYEFSVLPAEKPAAVQQASLP
ncbi:endonuclease/exonuclease/phosphatase family protein [Aquamicrobium sp. LC103]|uniref:endonuclease/exonuclease/phosphatase family protein n=1 Tax=Aquamicrobium sp. LC103 TaxID=1120658 RepID=UPI00063E8CB0|nr:endonuclease/exonuclease/phosphatase family protein [Aquamicrobium sp. LC103]TKT81261.1 AP endonuclease [Aquamicrobium sp. LC103]